MKKKCIYLYADILGYKNLMLENTVEELKNKLIGVLKDVKIIIDEKKTQENNKSIKIKEFYEYYNLPVPINENIYLNGNLSYYFAFDTLILYWEEIDEKQALTQEIQEAFINVVCLIFSVLYAKYHILIRGVISTSDNFFANDNILIIKEIEKAYIVEKYQEWGNIILMGSDFINILGSCHALDDTFKRLYYREVPFKKVKGKKFIDLILADNFAVKAKDLFPINITTGSYEEKILVLNPINRQCIGFLKDKKLYSSFIDVIEKMPDKEELGLSAFNKIKNTNDYLKRNIGLFDLSQRWSMRFG